MNEIVPKNLFCLNYPNNQLNKSWIFPFNDVDKGTSIVLYGAGEVGQNFYRQIMVTDYCKIEKWVDAEYKKYCSYGLSVQSPDSIEVKEDYCVVVAVEKSGVAKEIYEFLLKKGFASDRIVWNTYNGVDNKLCSNEYIEQRMLKELLYANVFHDTIKGSLWLTSDLSISPGNSAIGYPALYVLYRVLNDIRPNSLLELGLGQSTKVLCQYMQSFSDAHHIVVEHDEEWIAFFEKNFKIHSNTEVMLMPIKDINIQLNDVAMDSNCTIYEGFAEKLAGYKFDFILIDGPYGFRSPLFSRIDVLKILPDCLKESFVILIDDVNRQGEMNTMKEMMRVLESNHIPFSQGIYEGSKDTGIIVSKDLYFLCTL